MKIEVELGLDDTLKALEWFLKTKYPDDEVQRLTVKSYNKVIFTADLRYADGRVEFADGAVHRRREGV
jgi:hypothetical protein